MFCFVNCVSYLPTLTESRAPSNLVVGLVVGLLVLVMALLIVVLILGIVIHRWMKMKKVLDYQSDVLAM